MARCLRPPVWPDARAWIPVEQLDDPARLVISAERIRAAWPDRYETRVRPCDELRWSLEVRHRD